VKTRSQPFVLEIQLAQSGNFAIVPYILEISENQLRLCCPFLTQEIPKSFTGPGFVCMEKKIPGEQENIEPDLEIPTDPKESMLFYLSHCTEILKAAKISEEFPDDDPERAANRKVLKLIGIQNKIDRFQEKFPATTGDRVLRLLTGADTEEDEDISRSIQILRQTMIELGMIAEDKPKTEVNRKLVERKRKKKAKQAAMNVDTPPIMEERGNCKGGAEEVVVEAKAKNYGKGIAASALAFTAVVATWFFLRSRKN